MIKIYTTPECPYCKQAKAFLKSKGLEFEELDISKDETLRKEAEDKSGKRGTPVIDIDGEIVFGFDEEKLNRILK